MPWELIRWFMRGRGGGGGGSGSYLFPYVWENVSNNLGKISKIGKIKTIFGLGMTPL